MDVKEINDLKLLQTVTDNTKVLAQDTQGAVYLKIKDAVNQSVDVAQTVMSSSQKPVSGKAVSEELTKKMDKTGGTFTGDVQVGSVEENKNLEVFGLLKNNGMKVATLDPITQRIPSSQLPESAMEFKGNWNASTNTPALVDGTGTSGDMYKVSVEGKHTFHDEELQFYVGDFVMYNGSYWERSSGGLVQSVNGQNGVVELKSSDIPGSIERMFYAWTYIRDGVFTMTRKPSPKDKVYELDILTQRMKESSNTITSYNKSNDSIKLNNGSQFTFNLGSSSIKILEKNVKDSISELSTEISNRDNLTIIKDDGTEVEYNGVDPTSVDGIKKSYETRSVSSFSIASLKYESNPLGSDDINYLITNMNSAFWNALKTSQSLITYFSCRSSQEDSSGYLVYFNVDNGYAEVHLSNNKHFIATSGASDWSELNYGGGGSASPIGTIHAYTGTTAPAGFLFCDDSEYNQADYPDLANLVKDLPICQSTTPGKFKVPDLRNKFIEGAFNNLGINIAAGIPNITGEFGNSTFYTSITPKKAFSIKSTIIHDVGSSTNTGGRIVEFNAANGETKLDGTQKNDVFGKSDTVQPPAVTLNYIIKATQTKDDLETIIDDSKIDVGHALSGAKVNSLIHNSGKTYIPEIDYYQYSSYMQDVLLIIDDVPLIKGNVITLYFDQNCHALTEVSSSNLVLHFRSSGQEFDMQVYKNGEKNLILPHIKETKEWYFQKGTTLSLIFDGEDWVVMGNPVVLSEFSEASNYLVYADGYIEQWGKITSSTIVYPIKFRSYSYPDVNCLYDGNAAYNVYPRTYSTNGFNWLYGGTVRNDITVFWFARGY